MHVDICLPVFLCMSPIIFLLKLKTMHVSNFFFCFYLFIYLTEEAAQPDKDAEIFQNVQEGKDQGDLVDYGWANVGSFDDLDHIFR